MLSNAYFLAKFRFDTANNEPTKKLQNFADTLARFNSTPIEAEIPGERMERAGGDPPEAREEKGADDAGEPELRCAPEIPYLSAGRPLFCASMLFVPTYR